MTSLAELRALIETERDRFGVPGVAVAVVHDGEVLLAEGFGTRDLAGQSVTAQTLFPIASDTKCFTAATLCVLADEGLLDLDEPVQSYVPEFRMSDPVATALVSARDLLAHRTGLPRHDFVWYGEQPLELAALVASLRHLALNKQPRQAWQYNNLAYSTAGYLTERLAGRPWAEVVRERLLAPLGMSATGFDPHGEGDFARPYDREQGELVERVLPSRNNLGPPGGIVSNVDDMSQWLLARLGLPVNGERPLSDAARAQLHGPAMIGGSGAASFPERQPMGYALGCQVESYRGHRIVRHGGNLVGYSSDVLVAPEAGSAVVVLTNLHGTALRDALPLQVLDQLLGLEPIAWGERYHAHMTASLEGAAASVARRAESAAGRPPTRPLEEFAGTYAHPAYGELRLDVVGEGLKVDFHGLGDRVLVHHRDRDAFALSMEEFGASLPMVFQTGDDASVTSLTVPFEPLVDPIAFRKLPPAVTPGLMEQVPGTYTSGPLKVSVRIVGDTVQLTAPRAKARLVPAGGAVFTSPDMSTLRAEFVLAPDGSVATLALDPLGIFTREP